MLKHERQQQIAPFHAVAPLALDQPLRAAEPSGRAAELSPDGESHAHPERAPSRAERLAGVEVEVIRPLQALQVVAATEHVGRRPQQLHVLRPERRRPVGERQGLPGLSPRPARIRSAAALEGVGRVHQGLLPPASFNRPGSVRAPRGLGARHGISLGKRASCLDEVCTIARRRSGRRGRHSAPAVAWSQSSDSPIPWAIPYAPGRPRPPRNPHNANDSALSMRFAKPRRTAKAN